MIAYFLLLPPLQIAHMVISLILYHLFVDKFLQISGFVFSFFFWYSVSTLSYLKERLSTFMMVSEELFN